MEVRAVLEVRAVMEVGPVVATQFQAAVMLAPPPAAREEMAEEMDWPDHFLVEAQVAVGRAL